MRLDTFNSLSTLIQSVSRRKADADTIRQRILMPLVTDLLCWNGSALGVNDSRNRLGYDVDAIGYVDGIPRVGFAAFSPWAPEAYDRARPPTPVPAGMQYVAFTAGVWMRIFDVRRGVEKDDGLDVCLNWGGNILQKSLGQRLHYRAYVSDVSSNAVRDALAFALAEDDPEVIRAIERRIPGNQRIPRSTLQEVADLVVTHPMKLPAVDHQETANPEASASNDTSADANAGRGQEPVSAVNEDPGVGDLFGSAETRMRLYVTSKTGLKATVLYDTSDRSALLEKGSEIVREERNLRASNRKSRKAIIMGGSVKAQGDRYVLTKNVPLRSLSKAASVIHGTERNANDSWHDENGTLLLHIRPATRRTGGNVGRKT